MCTNFTSATFTALSNCFLKFLCLSKRRANCCVACSTGLKDLSCGINSTCRAFATPHSLSFTRWSLGSLSGCRTRRASIETGATCLIMTLQSKSLRELLLVEYGLSCFGQCFLAQTPERLEHCCPLTKERCSKLTRRGHEWG